MRWLWFLFVCFAATSAAAAQSLPNHADTSAREEAPSFTGVPAIRFLTSADYPPFNYRDAGGQLIGFHIDLANAICGVLSISCTMQSWPWEQAADALAENQGDALIAGLAITDENAKRFDFSNIYLMFPGRFAVIDGKGNLNDVLIGGTVSVRKDSAHAAFIEKYFPELKALEFETEALALQAMRDGDTEAWFGDALRASFWMNENPDCCTFEGQPYFNPSHFGEGMAIALPAGRGEVRAAINFALQRLQRNGRLEELYLRWFPVSFY